MKFGNGWDDILADEFNAEYYRSLRKFLISEYNSHIVYPKPDDVMNCFKFTAYGDVKVVILGQDPYHGVGQAEGLCFSVPDGIKKPPSLVNIIKECGGSGNLKDWTKQGVFLLNTILTVRASQPLSHKGKGWEIFTDFVISKINEKNDPMVFMLWGANARSKKTLITNPKHLILEAVHPSPLSAHNGFFGCGHFKKANEFLVKNGQSPIDW